ncbi:HIT family protein [Sulfurospirillum arsenophilum]|uniref:HIT family protein n=1 Tax=Sulfurospirillum arsenophilum TaxID=56698 RepID=UPI0005A7DE93|nr:HIT family protein [Sulfurospirillum arsenophilum]
MSEKLYENEYFYIEKENALIPWVKIFTQKPYKELSDCDKTTQEAILKAMLIVEETMRGYYNPKKINIAMFGNYVPHVHIHIMARFEEDSHFPESMWGVKQRESHLELPRFENFVTVLQGKLATV